MIKFNNKTWKTGNRHGAPSTHSPREISRVANFNDVLGEGQITSGWGGRIITVDALVVDTSFTSGKLLYDYLDKNIDGQINSEGVLEVDSKVAGKPKYKFSNCVFKGWQPVPQPGQRAAVPMPDVITYSNESLNDRVGPGGFYLEVLFSFHQLIP